MLNFCTFTSPLVGEVDARSAAGEGLGISSTNKHMNIESLLKNYGSFFSDLLQRQKKIGIDVPNHIPVSHFTYRVVTQSEYTNLRDQLKTFCAEFVETQFNGRAISILVLKNPLKLENDFSVSVIELPAPRAAHTYPSGFESLGFVIGKQLPDFITQHKSVLTGIKDHGIYCQPAFVTFDNDKTSKFYDISLLEIINLQGWRLQMLKS